MNALVDIFEAMKKAEKWIGSGDPYSVGSHCAKVLIENVNLPRNHRVLDFGCGVGRTSAPLADYLTKGSLVGIDIIKSQIDFCRDVITPTYPHASFYHLTEYNPMYEAVTSKEVKGDSSVDLRDFEVGHRHSFDTAFAYSVFTHFNPEMCDRYLGLLKTVTKNGAFIHATFFLNTPTNPDHRRLLKGEDFRDCMPEQPLTFALYRLGHIEEIAARHSLRISRVIYGGWRSMAPRRQGASSQDIVVFEKVPELPDDFSETLYVAANSDLQEKDLDATKHYLTWGFFENRPHHVDLSTRLESKSDIATINAPPTPQNDRRRQRVEETSIRFHGSFRGGPSYVLDEAFRTAIALESRLPLWIREMDGGSGRKYRYLANELVRLTPNASYLEVGSYKGSTLCSAIFENSATVTCIDHWKEFGGRNEFDENLARATNSNISLNIIENDFRAVDYSRIGKHNLYVFDGPHAEHDHYDGIILAQPALDPIFTLIVDDWDWPSVRNGTKRGMNDAGLEVLATIEIMTTQDDTTPTVGSWFSDWHNGYFMAVVKKKLQSRI